MRKFDDVFYTKDDLAIAYSARRKNLKKEEALDLLEVLIKFLKKGIKEEKEYAFQLPGVGVLYRKWETEMDDPKITPRFDRMMFDIMVKGRYRNPLLLRNALDRIYPEMELEEIQYAQNNS